MSSSACEVTAVLVCSAVDEHERETELQQLLLLHSSKFLFGLLEASLFEIRTIRILATTTHQSLPWRLSSGFNCTAALGVLRVVSGGGRAAIVWDMLIGPPVQSGAPMNVGVRFLPFLRREPLGPLVFVVPLPGKRKVVKLASCEVIYAMYRWGKGTHVCLCPTKPDEKCTYAVGLGSFGKSHRMLIAAGALRVRACFIAGAKTTTPWSMCWILTSNSHTDSCLSATFVDLRGREDAHSSCLHYIFCL